jgi:ribosome-binding factor A
MKRPRPSKPSTRRAAPAVGPREGVDPRIVSSRGSAGGRAGRKTAQLCHQVAETLEQLFAEQEDDVLQALHVVSVDAAPDESHLLVTVAPATGALSRDPIVIHQRLEQATGLLRSEVAGAITRRKVPGMSWRVTG